MGNIRSIYDVATLRVCCSGAGIYSAKTSKLAALCGRTDLDIYRLAVCVGVACYLLQLALQIAIPLLIE